jgi:solute carrier family 25 protein 39/40
MGKALKMLIRYRGVTGLWMGLPPTLMRDVPFSAIYWSCLEGLKTSFNQNHPNPQFVFVAGALSGGVSYLRRIIVNLNDNRISIA